MSVANSNGYKVKSTECIIDISILKQWIALNARADWLVKLRISCVIQQIVTLSKYGHDALDICHP